MEVDTELRWVFLTMETNPLVKSWHTIPFNSSVKSNSELHRDPKNVSSRKPKTSQECQDNSLDDKNLCLICRKSVDECCENCFNDWIARSKIKEYSSDSIRPFSQHQKHLTDHSMDLYKNPHFCRSTNRDDRRQQQLDRSQTSTGTTSWITTSRKLLNLSFNAPRIEVCKRRSDGDDSETCTSRSSWHGRAATKTATIGSVSKYDTLPSHSHFYGHKHTRSYTHTDNHGENCSQLETTVVCSSSPASHASTNYKNSNSSISSCNSKSGSSSNKQNNQKATKSANKKCFILLRKALRTFQCFIIFVQMQLMQLLLSDCNCNFKCNCNCIHTDTNTNTDNKYKNKNKCTNININSICNLKRHQLQQKLRKIHLQHNEQKRKENQQKQPRPPLSRLNLLNRNSYIIESTPTNITNNASPQQHFTTQQQNQQQQRQRQRHHHTQHHQHEQQRCQRIEQEHHPYNQSHQGNYQQLRRLIEFVQQQQQIVRQYFRSHDMLNNWTNRCSTKVKALLFLLLVLPSVNAQVSHALAPSPSASGFARDVGSMPAEPPLPSATTSVVGTQQVNLTRPEYVCRSMDLRNSPNTLRALENCTVIEGFLLVNLFNAQAQQGFRESYPLLTEITDFFMMYSVHNLRSISQLFPNLRVIRGRYLFDSFALIIYGNPDLEDLNLVHLMRILKGGVRIEKNKSLCFAHTVDWKQIVPNGTDIVIQNNRNIRDCPKCPGEIEGMAMEDAHTCKHCWNHRNCQKICPPQCPGNCIDEKTCCNEACLGGCSLHNPNECISCNKYSIYGNTCVDTCPPNYNVYLGHRCVTEEECKSIATKFENNKEELLVWHNGECEVRCAIGFKKVNATCVHCGDNCENICDGDLIDSVERSKEYHACTGLRGNLTISIKRGGRHLMEDLEFGLGSIKWIEGYLRVHRTFGMFSLGFFKKLKAIKGKYLFEDKFALYVLENNDLETIWNVNQTVRIEAGRVFFHFNPKLCYSEIEALRPMMKNDAPFDKNEVATDSNGSKGSCNTEILNTTIIELDYSKAKIKILNPLEFDDDRTFIGYRCFYMEDIYGNATKHSSRPCDDSWSTTEAFKDDNVQVKGLEPFTQYAYYIKTLTISSEPRNAQSNIQYFKTKSSQPKPVRNMRAHANSSSEIVMTWNPPIKVNGNLTKFNVRAIIYSKSQIDETRDYCADPVVHEQPVKKTNVLPEVPPNCKCEEDRNVISYYDEEKSEPVIDEGINFENTLQNFIYVKHNTTRSLNLSEPAAAAAGMKQRRRRSGMPMDPMDSFLIRHMRNVQERELLESSTARNDIIFTTSTTAAPSLNDTQLDPTGQYYLKIFESIEANSTTGEYKYTFSKLRHFSIYEVGVQACRAAEEGANPAECSNWFSINVQTKWLTDVDIIENLQIDLETTNTSQRIVRMRWDPPLRPNGAVTSYTIVYKRQAQDAQKEKKCIRETKFRNMSQGYELKGLSTGNYSIEVIANSLAGAGNSSRAQYIYIPPSGLSTATILLICSGVLVVIILSVVAIVCMRKRMAPPTDLKIFPTVNPYYISLQYIPDEWEVARDRVIQLSPLGQGSFGMVYEGILKGYDNSNEDTPCAIKTVNENATDRERMNFLNEASVMKQFDTYHVVRLLGVCSSGQPALVIMELMKNGDLKSYLRAHRPDERDAAGLEAGPGDGPLQPPPLSRIYQMAIEIADGMAYLSAKKFVHRDLAARNCMVAADLTVKIGDFGMTRDIYETDYYRKGTKGLLPVRWMPPESLRDGVYSSASDVFSYGVVLWEMATLASQPYQGLTNDQVLRYVIDGGVMERPEKCPDKLYRLMQSCWHHRPTARPTFMEIIRYLLEMANDHFSEVSFYHSDEGKEILQKEQAENLQHCGDIFNWNENEMDDVTTPLRMDEYNNCKLNVDNNSSVENHGDSPMAMDAEYPNSPSSLGSAAVISSTPDGQSKNSFVNKTVSSSDPNYQTYTDNDVDFTHGMPYFLESALKDTSKTEGIGSSSKPVITDEQGYELYDPSPNSLKHQGSYDPADNEEDFDGISKFGRSSSSKKMIGTQYLLPSIMRGAGGQRMPTILRNMSSSMPDDVIDSAPSALNPSTASAASSNASSSATAPSKYTSLKRVVAAGHNLMPSRLRNINQRIFQHKRSGSNASHKSTGSNPNTSSTNLPGTRNQTAGTSSQGHNLGTIESGGSGSAGSSCPTMPYYPSTTAYEPMFEPPELGSSEFRPTAMRRGKSLATTLTTSSNPNYQLLDETLNTTAGGTPPTARSALANPIATSDNPNYVSTPAPLAPTVEQSSAQCSSSDNPNYVEMNQPQVEKNSAIPFLRTSENPNYKVASPARYLSLSSALRGEKNRDHAHGSATSSPTSGLSSSENEPDDDDDEDDEHTEHIKMERMPLSRRRGGGGGGASSGGHKRSSRSRSQSQTKSEREKSGTPTTTTQSGGGNTAPTSSATTAKSQAGKPASSFSLKEMWLRQQPRLPPPNGFIGPET